MDVAGRESGGEIDLLLDELQALAERTYNNFTLVRVLAMRAVWLARQGKAAAAQQALERALRLGRPGGFIQAFAEQGPPILELLQAASPRLKAAAGLGDYLAALIAACSAPRAAGPAPSAAGRTPAAPPAFKTLLTVREMEVLALLAERLSIQEISARLFISPSTVQQHTHHIYRKLNVANKRQAVTRAIELGLLPARP